MSIIEGGWWFYPNALNKYTVSMRDKPALNTNEATSSAPATRTIEPATTRRRTMCSWTIQKSRRSASWATVVMVWPLTW